LGVPTLFLRTSGEKGELRIDPCNLMQVMLTQEKMEPALCFR